MYVDRSLAAVANARTARDHGVDVLLDAWSGAPPDRRAAMVTAQGDLARGASYAAGFWAKLLQGDVSAALAGARNAIGSPGMAFLEAEALFAAGAVVAGLGRLEALHRQGEPAGTVALVRRRYQLGDNLGAVNAAQSLPWQAHVALIGARAALAAGRPVIGLRFAEPYLQGVAPLPEPGVAGAFAVVTASILARLGDHEHLQGFVDRLLGAGDLAEDMMPTVARAAWIAGRGREAWRRFDAEQSPWCVAARLELAILAGDAELAVRLLERAGPLGVPSAPALKLLRGEPVTAPSDDGDRRLTASARQVFAEGHTVHVWRTHPHRWQPWIDAALTTPAQVVVCDLAANELPDAESLPVAVMDDGALVEALAPVRGPDAVVVGSGVTIGSDLCRGVGVGHDWLDEETEVARRGLPGTDGPGIRVLSAEDALANAASGRPLVAIAPPGDPFWGGPHPERVWPSVRVVRSSPQSGWVGAGTRVVAAAESFCHPRSEAAGEG